MAMILQGGRVKYTQTAAGNLNLDRFQIDLNTNVLEYCDTSESDEETKTIGSLENNWIQCRYNWRYSIFEDEMFYWLYEDITLNAISIDSLNTNVFLSGEASDWLRRFKISGLIFCHIKVACALFIIPKVMGLHSSRS